MSEFIAEPERRVPVVDQCDVLVAGGGPAGVAAAIAAARTGARVTLVEAHGQLGGIWTSGLLAWILDAAAKPGVMRLILDRLRAIGARSDVTFGAFACDVEKVKLLLENLCAEHGVRVRLHTRVAAAAVQQGRLRAVLTESKSGREAWVAKSFIDCTGDGDLAAAAGCGFAIGHPETGATQPMSLIHLIGGVQYEQIQHYVHDKRNGKGFRDGTRNLLDKLKSVGIEPSYGAPIVMHVYDDLFLVMANHEYGAKATNADDLSRATMHARQELHAMFDALRERGGHEWANVKIVATAAQIGVREGRRIRGRYELTTDDLTSGRRFEDGICPVTFGVDVHAPDPSKGKAYDSGGVKAKPYDVPLRALIAADVNALLMAGRCISGDFFAHASYRVTGNAVSMGQAAGICAALAAKSDVLPHEVPFEQVAKELDALNYAHPVC